MALGGGRSPERRSQGENLEPFSARTSPERAEGPGRRTCPSPQDPARPRRVPLPLPVRPGPLSLPLITGNVRKCPLGPVSRPSKLMEAEEWAVGTSEMQQLAEAVGVWSVWQERLSCGTEPVASGL